MYEREVAVNAVSEPEKKADRKSKKRTIPAVNIIVQMLQFGRSMV